MQSSATPNASTRIDPRDLSATHDVLVSLAFQAGQVLLSSYHSRSTSPSPSPLSDPLDIREKQSSVDLVTQVDEAAERIILDGLAHHFGAVDVALDILSIRAGEPGAKVVVVAEESYARTGETRCLVDQRPTFVCDPLDGTVNSVHLNPNVCIALGLCIDRVPVVGVTYAPLLSSSFLPPLAHPSASYPVSAGLLWSSVQGRGAWQNQVYYSRRADGAWRLDPEEYSINRTTTRSDLYARLTSRPDTDVTPEQSRFLNVPPPVRLPIVKPALPFPSDAPKGCLLAAEWGKDRRETPESNLLRKLASLHNLASATGTRAGKGGHVHGVRSLGSSALDLVAVACGQVDIMWEGGCWEWDVCAGTALLLEAGGYIVDANPPPPSSPLWNPGTDLPLAPLGGRRYLAVRACSAPTTGLSERQAGEGVGEQAGKKGAARREQERVIREVWKRVEPFLYERPV